MKNQNSLIRTVRTQRRIQLPINFHEGDLVQITKVKVIPENENEEESVKEVV